MVWNAANETPPMKRRITSAIVGVTSLTLLILGIPLAIAVQRSIVSQELVRLQGTSTGVLAEINVPIDLAQLGLLRNERDLPPPFGIYNSNGRRVYGVGPLVADDVVSDARRSREQTVTAGNEVTVATPILNRAEKLQGVLRISTSRHEIDERTRVAWAIMIAAGSAALALAGFLARRIASDLASPLHTLARRANGFLDGTDEERLPMSGVAEIDQLTAALQSSFMRVASALARERQFSADVAHQLRTPLTGIRLKVESASSKPATALIATDLLGDLDLIEATVARLLALARDTTPAAHATTLQTLLDNVVRQWTPSLATNGGARRLVAENAAPHADQRVLGTPNGITQILDVLIDNAVRHGSGIIRLTTRALPGAVAISVSDEGHLLDTATESLMFSRRSDTGPHTGQGIGLAVARSLAEADDSRLTLTSRHPTTFTLFLVSAPKPTTDQHHQMDQT
jgi:signal transduction histidine kinase